MKRMIFSTLLVVGASVLFVGCYLSDKKSETYSILKVYRYSETYKIYFKWDDDTIGIFWVRDEWINDKNSVGNITYGQSRDYYPSNYPSISIYFYNGEFDNFNLYLVEDKDHVSWGVSETYYDIVNRPGIPTFSASAQFKKPFYTYSER